MLNVLVSVVGFLFSRKGRISRLPFWGYHIAMTLVAWFGLISLTLATFGPLINDLEAGETVEATGQSIDMADLELYAFAGVFLWTVYIWSNCAVNARRWHDRDKSGWWSLIAFIPIIGPLWMFIECGFLPGTRGSNRFGDAPGSSGRTLVDVFE